MRSNYIGGSWIPSAAESGIDVVNPATEEVIDRVPAGHPADVDAAVGAARAAFSRWAATPVAERARRLDAARELLAERVDAVSAAIAADMGSPIGFARKVQVGTPLAVLASYVELRGRRWGDHAVELPAIPGSEQGCRRARRWLPGGTEAE